MRAIDSLSNTFVAAGSTPFVLLSGGLYHLAGHSAAWGGGNVAVAELLPDGTSVALSTILKLTADGAVNDYLPPGQYRLTLTTTAAATVTLCRVPFE